MPQPCPAVSPVQTKLCPRGTWFPRTLLRPAADAPAAVVSEPTPASLTVPASSSNCRVSWKRLPAGRFAALILAV